MKPLILALPILIIILVSGCTQPTPELTPEQREVIRAETACVFLCKLELGKGSLEAGPCLSNDIFGDGVWVCDVAHLPRKPADNLIANQCPAFGQTASRFVEVDEDCEVIRTK